MKMQPIGTVGKNTLLSKISQEFQSRNSSSSASSQTVPCGVWAKTQLLYSRVVGGSDAEGPIPWQVGIRKRIRNSNQFVHWCGAAIINEFWMVSAAHCFKDPDITRYILRVGDFDNSMDAKGKYEMEFEIENLIQHPNYNDMTHDYDVALIKVRPGNGIQFSVDVAPICLPEPGQPQPGQLCYASGWGRINSWKYAEILQLAVVPVISNEKCSSMKIGGYTITERMLCAGYQHGGIDTCKGDSGGPLVCPINGKYVLYGLTSFGVGCGEANSPGVYVNVPVVREWMKHITGV